jgi:Spy/CpxP family protein refolding chaperone
MTAARVLRSLAAAMALAGAAAAGAAEAPPTPFVDWLVQALHLDATTAGALERIATAEREASAGARTRVDDARRTLRAQLDEPDPDEESVMAQIDQLSELQAALWKARLRGLIRIRWLLTPEQRERLAALQRTTTLETVRACRADVQTVCPDARRPRARIACLADHRDALSESCRAALERGRLGHVLRTP